MTSTARRGAHIGAFHKYCYWRAEIRVSHAGVIRFTLRTEQPLLPQREIFLSFALIRSSVLRSAPRSFVRKTTRSLSLFRARPTFFSLFLPSSPRALSAIPASGCPAFASTFSLSSPLPCFAAAAAALLHSSPFSCSALFRAVEIVCPYGGRAAIRRGRSNEKGGVNGISRGRHGHRRQR